jgi:hypothetical protein
LGAASLLSRERDARGKAGLSEPEKPGPSFGGLCRGGAPQGWIRVEVWAVAALSQLAGSQHDGPP